ncbi:MAG: hypothetical protein JOZ51_08000 [Chloroflexi bacterium]|nr:hypothetical protein [Chloroflexota bacterium]
MDMLIKEITERTGISESQARDAVQMVANYIKTQLPEPIAAQVDSMLGGQGGAQGGQDLGGQAQQVLGNLGGMFNKQ